MKVPICMFRLSPCIPFLTCCNQTGCAWENYQLVPVCLTLSSTQGVLNRSSLHLTTAPQPQNLMFTTGRTMLYTTWPAALFFFFKCRVSLYTCICHHFQHLRPLLPDLKDYSRLKALSISLFCSNTEVTEMLPVHLGKGLKEQKKVSTEVETYHWLQ